MKFVTINFWELKVNIQGHWFWERLTCDGDDMTLTLACNH